jgi:hypothetical protein
MDFFFGGDWDEANQDIVRKYISELWLQIDGEAPDQDLLDYVMVFFRLI